MSLTMMYVFRSTVAILVSYNVFRLRPSKTIYDKRNRYQPRNRNRPSAVVGPQGINCPCKYLT